MSLSYLEGISKNQIDIRSHALKWKTINKEWSYKYILNEEPQLILKTKSNRFKIYYKNPTKEDKI